MPEPLIIGVALFLAMCVPVWLASAGNPRPKRRRRHGRDYGAMAEVEENDIAQMIEGINERRRRNGRAEIGDELAAELLRDPRRRREQL
ncbi:MAG TPA: hypothetical protein VNB64_00360 [Solirubrobacteraceae bacterium]|nr:hypothetical protein [Solirubrobacteraceae bacterium]